MCKAFNMKQTSSCSRRLLVVTQSPHSRLYFRRNHYHPRKGTDMVTREGSRPPSAEQRLTELGIKLPTPPEPFGAYAEAVQTGNLLFLSGMLPTEGHGAKFIGRIGAELDVEAGRTAA